MRIIEDEIQIGNRCAALLARELGQEQAQQSIGNEDIEIILPEPKAKRFEKIDLLIRQNKDRNKGR